jgi:hypothetical protein
MPLKLLLLFVEALPIFLAFAALIIFYSKLLNFYVK